jgi:uncharacterized membrane protein
MDWLEVIDYLLMGIFFALAGSVIGSAWRDQGFVGGVLGFVMGPFGLVMIYYLADYRRRCGVCFGVVHAKAICCNHCGSEFTGCSKPETAVTVKH